MPAAAVLERSAIGIGQVFKKGLACPRQHRIAVEIGEIAIVGRRSSLLNARQVTCQRVDYPFAINLVQAERVQNSHREPPVVGRVLFTFVVELRSQLPGKSRDPFVNPKKTRYDFHFRQRWNMKILGIA